LAYVFGGLVKGATSTRHDGQGKNLFDVFLYLKKRAMLSRRRACFLSRLGTGLSDIPSPSQESETITDIAGEYAPLFSRMSGFGGCAVMP
jgi:hypothetical protein